MTAVPAVTGWWAGRSDPQRIDLYTRWSFYATIAALPPVAVLFLGSATVARPVGAALYLGGTIAVTAGALLLARSGLAARGREGAPAPRLAAGAAVLALATAGAGVIAFTGTGTGTGAEGDALPWVVALPPLVVLTAGATVWSTRALTAGGAAIGTMVALALLGSGLASEHAIALGVLMGAVATGIALSFRFTVWVLDVVTQLEQARHAQARLAVAEERLRFARDLHDVMGRNLSAIAVKAQLAAELARRGRPQAVEEIADVSRIAEESLREVRGVVSGYRDVTLAGELAGARSVLRAAGIACTVTGDQEGGALPVTVQTALGWVVREAVTNVLRHSRATTCAITLEPGLRTATLRVVNDGAGSAPEDMRWGNGLTGLAERLVAAGGRLTATRDDGSFVLAACVPVGVPA
jgi:two-component system sensor histidine kinase DesK